MDTSTAATTIQLWGAGCFGLLMAMGTRGGGGGGAQMMDPERVGRFPVEDVCAFPNEWEIKRQHASPRELVEVEAALAGTREEIDALRRSTKSRRAIRRPAGVGEPAAGVSTPPRVVSTGFADLSEPGRELPPDRQLARGGHYLFWLEIAGALLPGAIDSTAPPLPAGLSGEIEVVLFAFDGGLEIRPGADLGRLELTPGGARVLQQPGKRPPAGVADELAARRLLFPVRAPARPGKARLRCNLYHRGLLLQSRRVTTSVGRVPKTGVKALDAEVDFVLSTSLDPAALAAHGEHALSLMVNDDGEGVHGLRGWAGPGVKIESRIAAGALADLIGLARGALRYASWESEKDWDEPEPEPGAAGPPARRYRYQAPGARWCAWRSAAIGFSPPPSATSRPARRTSPPAARGKLRCWWSACALPCRSRSSSAGKTQPAR